MALAPLSQTIFLTEDGSVVPSPKAVTIPPRVDVPAVTLGLLTLSAELAVGVVTTGTIIGATPGSTIVETVTGLTIDSAARTFVWDGTGSAGTVANGLVETHPFATNNGYVSPITIAASAAPTLANTPGTSTTILGSQLAGFAAWDSSADLRLDTIGV
jgi:hypothetical protein